MNLTGAHFSSTPTDAAAAAEISMSQESTVEAAALAAAQTDAGELLLLDVDAVVASLTNPRTVFDDEDLAELAESIRAGGIHQPILVRPLPASRLDETSRKLGRTQRETHELVSGERRWRASKLAGMSKVPAVARRLTDAEVLKIQLIENLQRVDLSELEEAEGFHRLVTETDIPKRELGAAVGKSREYVYARLKLLDLNPAAREAFRRGQIDASKALLIARIPVDKLQIKALGQATGSDNYGRALNVKEFQEWLQTNVMLPLKRAPFDVKDATLCESAGACADCPKRTGANPDLFADVESADICTDPTCYQDKEKTTAERRFEEAQREGKKVIDQEQAAGMLKADSNEWLRGHYLLDRYPDYSLEIDGPTLRKALGKHCPEPVLAKHPETGDIVEVLPIDQVKKIVRTNNLTRSAKRKQKEAAAEAKNKAEQAQLPIEERPEFEVRWQATALKLADEYLQREPAAGTPDLLRAWMIDEDGENWEASQALQAVLGEKKGDISKLIARTPDEEVPRLLLRFMLHLAAERYRAWSPENAKRQGPRSVLHEILHMTKVDLAEVKAEAKREIESEERAAETEAQAKQAEKTAPKPAKGQKAKKSTAPPAAQAPRAKKISKEQAQRDIADALQAHEDEKNSQSQAPIGANEEKGAAPAAPAPTFSIGQLVKVKAGSKGPGGKFLKSIGRVGRVFGLGDDGRVHMKHGERRHELLVVEADHLEPYAALPTIGDQVRILRTGIAPGQDKLLWRSGTVETCDQDGWGVRFPPLDKGDIVGAFAHFENNCLEVLA